MRTSLSLAVNPCGKRVRWISWGETPKQLGAARSCCPSPEGVNSVFEEAYRTLAVDPHSAPAHKKCARSTFPRRLSQSPLPFRAVCVESISTRGAGNQYPDARQGGMRCPQRVGQESGYAADVCAFGRLPAAIVFGEADPPFAAAAI